MKREIWIDIVRGGAILLVVIGHSNCPELLYNLIYSFHMPLFFIISGYLYNYEKWNAASSYKSFVLHCLVSYIKPYLILCGINLAFCLGKAIIANGLSAEHILLVKKWVYGILYAYPSTNYMPNCTPLWFLVALFWANLIFYRILEIKSRTIQIVIVGLIALVDAGLSLFCSYQLPWCFGAVLIGTCCMYVGFCLKNSSWKSCHPLALFLFSCLGLWAGYINGKVGVAENNLGQTPVLFWCSALSLSFVVLSVVYRSKIRCELLAWFGRNTIIFMGFNYFFNDLSLKVWEILPYSSQYTYTWYMKSLVCVLCICLVIPIWNAAKRKHLV